jgi:hypothetical protein
MLYHLTNHRLVVPWIALGLAVVCAFVAALLSRRKMAPPFRNYFSPDHDRSLLPKDAMNESEDAVGEEHSTFSEFSSRYRESSGWRARAQGGGES